MGFWGTGLYAGDFACDLRSTVAAVVRLPFDSARLVEILCETEPAAANNPDDEEHGTFWIVVADQFAKRGIVSQQVREKALGIIDAGDDIATMQKLGLNPSDLRKRRKMLEEIRARIVSASSDKPRKVLKEPQPLLMEIGDVLVYPVCGGKCINPYFASKELNKVYTRNGPRPWTQDSWAAAVIIDCGRAFDFLSWYRPLTVAQAMIEKPTVEILRGPVVWRLDTPGTCSPLHFKKMEFEKIGRIPLDLDKLRNMFPGMRPGVSAAVSDISIANRLNVAPYSETSVLKPGPHWGRTPVIESLDQLVRIN